MFLRVKGISCQVKFVDVLLNDQGFPVNSEYIRIQVDFTSLSGSLRSIRQRTSFFILTFIKTTDLSFSSLVRSGRETAPHPNAKPEAHGANGLKILENAQLLCEMPLQTGEANPWFGQLPLSRATDHIDSRVM